MKKFDLKDLTPQMMKGLTKVQSAEELIEKARLNDFELDKDQAEKFFKQLQSAQELGDDELDKVAGGGCILLTPTAFYDKDGVKHLINEDGTTTPIPKKIQDPRK